MTTRAPTVLAICLAVAGAHAQPTLFGIRNGEPPSILKISPSGPSSIEILTDGPKIVGPEIEFADGVLYLSDSQSNGQRLYRLDPDTGAFLGDVTLTYPAGLPGTPIILAMEDVDGVMYAGVGRIAGQNEDTRLCTLDPDTGVLTLVGTMGIDRPTVGLAWDGTTMYGVTGGGEPAQFFTVDLIGGTATVISQVSTASAPSLRLTALEFGPDGGALFAMSAIGAGSRLYVINKATGDALELGDPGVPVALTTRDSEPDPGCSGADLAEPIGILNFNDVIEFLTIFAAGCP